MGRRKTITDTEVFEAQNVGNEPVGRAKQCRIEHDSLGDVEVEADKLWGAQTERCRRNFRFGGCRMPIEVVHAVTLVKKAAAHTNALLGTLPPKKREAIENACDQILAGSLDDAFPLPVWQTGSGTHTNMNVNEVISNLAEKMRSGHIPDASEGRFLHPNDDVNKSQSTNDVFPTAIRVAAALLIHRKLLPALQSMQGALIDKSLEFSGIVKIGRTHLMDATPLTLGQEFSAFASQLAHDVSAIHAALPHLMELPIGGTAVGTGLNAPEGYDACMVESISSLTGLGFTAAANKFEGMASHDSLVEMSGALKRTAVSLMKIANDFRLLGSGPRCGVGELQLPANEPGSSIMPGKVNPTQSEALSMVCCQVIGNDVAITTGALHGHLQLNVFMPLIARNLTESISLLADAVNSFTEHCINGVAANLPKIQEHLEQSLMLVTALNPKIGYAKAAQIAQHAYSQGLTLKESAVELGLLTAEQFDEWVVPDAMV